VNSRPALVGMGSNIDPESNLRCAARAIRQRFADARFSRVYRSAAVGMEGDDFLNACCLFDTSLSCERLVAWLKGLEDMQGRSRAGGAWQSRTLDLDLLMLGTEVLDDDLFRYAHVYVPAAELLTLDILLADPSAVALHPLRL